MRWCAEVEIEALRLRETGELPVIEEGLAVTGLEPVEDDPAGLPNAQGVFQQLDQILVRKATRDRFDGRCQQREARHQDGATGRGELATITFRARSPRPRSEVRVLSVAAVSPSGISANVAVPGPFAISIAK